MMIRSAFTASAAVAIASLVAGCSTPSVKGDSVQNQKQLSYPKVGVQSTAAAGSLAVLYSNYQSRHVFHLAQPFSISVMLLNKIVVPTDERLIESDVDGKTLYCTEHNTYIDAITGPWAHACFKSSTPGRFNAVIYRPGAVWLTKDISPEVGFTSQEIQDQGQVAPLKRELVFDGAQGSTLMFSERIYEKSLQTRSRIKPIITNVASVPTRVAVDGMDIKVVSFDANTITFEVVTPWQ